MATKEYTAYGVVYCISNTVNSKLYVGQTTRSIKARLQGHFCSTGKNACPMLHEAIKKYGREVFSIRQLGFAESQSELDALERFEIERLQTRDRRFGYNLAEGGGYGKQSPETIAKRVAKTKGQKRSPEFCSRVSEVHRGVPKSDQQREKLRKAALARSPASTETRKKLSEASQGRRWTDEQRLHMAEVGRGRKHSKETKDRLALLNTGKVRSKDAIDKTAAANRGKKRTPETKAKMSAARKAYWAARKSAYTEMPVTAVARSTVEGTVFPPT